MTYDFLKSLYADVVSIIRGLVVKRVDLARENETVDTARAFETYLHVSMGHGTSIHSESMS